MSESWRVACLSPSGIVTGQGGAWVYLPARWASRPVSPSGGDRAVARGHVATSRASAGRSRRPVDGAADDGGGLRAHAGLLRRGGRSLLHVQRGQGEIRVALHLRLAGAFRAVDAIAVVGRKGNSRKQS